MTVARMPIVELMTTKTKHYREIIQTSVCSFVFNKKRIMFEDKVVLRVFFFVANILGG